MTDEQLEKLREWIRAEAWYAVCRNEVESDGYFSSAVTEEKEADRLYDEVKIAFNREV